ncbi:MAG TPA: hypothetical protein VJ809_03105, partial [Pirellulales bacterium]|nr:hypothetical protein [Pirellulales bacterium]
MVRSCYSLNDEFVLNFKPRDPASVPENWQTISLWLWVRWTKEGKPAARRTPVGGDLRRRRRSRGGGFLPFRKCQGSGRTNLGCGGRSGARSASRAAAVTYRLNHRFPHLLLYGLIFANQHSDILDTAVGRRPPDFFMMQVTAKMRRASFASVLATVAMATNRLNAKGALARYDDLFALAIKTGHLHFLLFAFPAANFAQACLAAAVGTATVMAGEARAAAG